MLGLRRSGLVLDAGVEILGVLAHDDEVDVVVARAHAVVGLARPEARVEPELVAQRDVHRPEAGPDRGRDRAFESDPVLLHGVERLSGERRPGGLHHLHAGPADIPVEPDAGRLEDAAGGFRELGPRTIAGNQGDAVPHRGRRVHTETGWAGSPETGRPAAVAR